jgi:alpha-glucuronidase
MKSGRTLWQELCGKYYTGAEQAADLKNQWQALEGSIDQQRYREVAERLEIQVADAAKWRDHILRYFQQYSGMPIQ